MTGTGARAAEVVAVTEVTVAAAGTAGAEVVEAAVTEAMGAAAGGGIAIATMAVAAEAAASDNAAVAVPTTVAAPLCSQARSQRVQRYTQTQDWTARGEWGAAAAMKGRTQI